MKNLDTRPVALKIKRIIKENENTNTYVFEYNLKSKPGQFVMMWIPGVDEKPFSVAYDDGKEFWIMVCNVGSATNELFKLKAGDKVGIRGPFGKHFEFKKGEHLALVAGGYGVAPMYNIAHRAIDKGCKVEFIFGARNKDLLLYTQKVSGLHGVALHISTDDGSCGMKGFTTNVLENLINSGVKLDHVFACGPEKMEYFLGQIAEKYKIDCQMAVEKYMKCGFGVCGQCAIDSSGECVCKKGTVMNWKILKKLSEFGKYHRDAQGKKQYF